MAGALVVGMIVASASLRAAEDGMVVLTIGGQPGVKVAGACLARTAADDARETIAAEVPFERRWQASGLRCELQTDGPATIEVTRGGSRSRTATSGGRIVIDVR